MPAFEDLQDIPEVEDDLEVIRHGFKLLGVKEKNTRIVRDATYEDFKDIYNFLMNRITVLQEQAKESNQEPVILVFFYYGGHGLQENYTYACLNSQTKTRYNVETMLRNF